MSKSAMIRARTEPQLKKSVEYIFKKLGISATEAINLFYRQVIMRNGIPFNIEIPNELTERTIKDARKRRNIKSFNSVNELFDDLES